MSSKECRISEGVQSESRVPTGKGSLYLERAAAGLRETQLAELAYKPAYRAAYKVLKDHHAAMDVAQDTLIVLWAYRKPIQNLEAFATKVAKRRAINEINRRENQKDREQRALRGSPPGIAQDDDAVLARLALDQAIKQLPARQRLAVRLYLFDLDHKSAAKRMGITTGAFKAHRARAFKTLRAYFESEDEYNGGGAK